MSEPILNELVNRFNIISKSLAVDKFNYPQLEIKMRMNWEEPALENFVCDVENGRKEYIRIGWMLVGLRRGINYD